MDMGPHAHAVCVIGRKGHAPLRLGQRPVKVLGPHVSRAERKMAGRLAIIHAHHALREFKACPQRLLGIA